MRGRMTVLNDLLEGCVHRKSVSVLQQYLPPKFEYVISVSMTSLQKRLYRSFLASIDDGDKGGGGEGTTKKKASEGRKSGKSLFNAYHQLAKVWTHPGVLALEALEKEEREVKEYNSIDDFMVSESDEGWSGDSDAGFGALDGFSTKNKKGKTKDKNKNKRKQGTLDMPSKKKPKKAQDDEHDDDTDDSSRWWQDIMEGLDVDDPTHSGKLCLLLGILQESAKCREKVLLFSQSLDALELIERCLSKTKKSQWCVYGCVPARARACVRAWECLGGWVDEHLCMSMGAGVHLSACTCLHVL